MCSGPVTPSRCTITEVLHLAGARRCCGRLPAWTGKDFHGLNRFIRFTVKNSKGKLVFSQIKPFCPNQGNPQRTGPGSPANSPFPQQCASNPFQLGMVYGLQKDWANDPVGERLLLRRPEPEAQAGPLQGDRSTS